MRISAKLLNELQRRLKVGNRRGVHLNAIPSNSRYKFDVTRLAHIDKSLPNNFVDALLSQRPLKFRISWKDNVPDLNTLFEEEQIQLVRITKAFENLINQTEAIESEKGINTFGFGFPLLVRRDRLDNKLTVAPVVIWSLRIRRTKEFNTWEITRNDDDAVYVNEVLINHLQTDANVAIEQIPEEMFEDGLLDEQGLLRICTDLVKAINSSPPSNIEELFSEKVKELIPINERAHYESLPLNETNSLIEFAGLFSIFEVQKQNIIQDYDHLMSLEGVELKLDDMKDHVFQSISSVETDPSQQHVLHSLELRRNLLVQGPPGTGKSQTLMAILVNALENQKKTIVVCEKKTALDILHKGLKERGLGDNCVLIKDIVTDRRAVVDSVRARIDAYNGPPVTDSKASLQKQINRAVDLIKRINKKHVKVGSHLIGSRHWTHIVGELLSEIRGYGDQQRVTIDKHAFDHSFEEFNDLLDTIEKGERYFNDFKAVRSRSFLNPLKFVGESPYIIEAEIRKDFSFYEKTANDIRSLIDDAKSKYYALRMTEWKGHVETITSMIAQIRQKEHEFPGVLSRVREAFISFRRDEMEGQLEQLERITTEIKKVSSLLGDQGKMDEDELKSVKFRFLSLFFKKYRTALKYSSQLTKLFAHLKVRLQSCPDFKQRNFEGKWDAKQLAFSDLQTEMHIMRNGLDQRVEKDFITLGLPQSLDQDRIVIDLSEAKASIPSMSNRCIEKLVELNNHLLSYAQDLKLQFDRLFQYVAGCKDLGIDYPSSQSYRRNNKHVDEIEETVASIAEALERQIESEFLRLDLLAIDSSNLPIPSIERIQQLTRALVDKFNADKWVGIDIVSENVEELVRTIEKLIEEKDLYFNSGDDCFLAEFNWRRYYNSLSTKSRTLIDELQSTEEWRSAFVISYLDTLLVKSSSLYLPTDDKDHVLLRETLSAIEPQQLKFIKKFWHSRQYHAAQLFNSNDRNLSVTNLYNKRSSNKFRRLSLRQIVQHDSDLFTNFFPIVLTTPDVACNLFRGMNGYFDIVMFDEASQLRLEDNLPAVLKGKQVVIAGDEHQMPPSNYFSKLLDGTADDEDDLEEEQKLKDIQDEMYLSCESLLEFATELNFNKRYLDFHYRSQHPYLIDFSNYAFYNQRLKPLENTFDYSPIKYIQVDGTFSDHTNEAEAETVLSILENNINRLPNGKYPTVGIATFNINQRNLIKSKILERQKLPRYAKFNSKIQELEAAGMFIKNLENIQGDERDVIILSTTYGIGKDRKFAQRFGPLIHSKGYKLLNVIITRAKYKIYVCSSIPEPAFMDFKEHLVTERANNKKAVLYAYLAYCKAVSEGDHELRLSVLTALAENTSKTVSFAVPGAGLESPFEEEVFQCLAERVGREHLVPQYKFGGFRIDIVYDPRRKGYPRIAIECDGAKFHTEREAYLHDIHRQRILEAHGFKFHRIWSTNWWRNSKRELDNLVNYIEQIMSAPPLEVGSNSSLEDAFVHNISTTNRRATQTSFIYEDESREVIQTLAATVEPPKIRRKEVETGSKVHVRYVNNGKDIVVQLVQSENNKNGTSGVQKIYNRSALATSLIGKCEGDIVKVGNLDNFVEILTIY